jgi:hypothetical protein
LLSPENSQGNGKGNRDDIGAEVLMTMDSMEDCQCYECANNSENEISLCGGKGGCDDDLMIADTGASVHIRKNTQILFDIKEEKCTVKYGNGTHSI